MPRNNVKENLSQFERAKEYEAAATARNLPPFGSNASSQKPSSAALPPVGEIIDLCSEDDEDDEDDWNDDILPPHLNNHLPPSPQVSRLTPPTQLDDSEDERSSEVPIPIVRSDNRTRPSTRPAPPVICLGTDSVEQEVDPGNIPSSPSETQSPINRVRPNNLAAEKNTETLEFDFDSIPEPEPHDHSFGNSSCVDLTNSVTENPNQSRISSYFSEKVGLLESKVQKLISLLDENKIKYDVGDLDTRIERVNNSIASLAQDENEEVATQMEIRATQAAQRQRQQRQQQQQSPPSKAAHRDVCNLVDDEDDLIISSQMEVEASFTPFLAPSSPCELSPLPVVNHYKESQVPPTNIELEQSPYFAPVEEPRPSQLDNMNPWSDEVYQNLSGKFGLLRFRSKQREIVNCTLSGKDAIVLMPTGGGKSLCYQLPALCKKGATSGTTIVISPLISLMQDQVYHLKNRNISAQMINSTLAPAEKESSFRELARGELTLVYLSPEMLSYSNRMRSELQALYNKRKLARIVIDEAHCVSSWGHDFREDYLKLIKLKDDFPGTPVLALTGTANNAVLSDIKRCVRSDHELFKDSFNRPNLSYEVREKVDSRVIGDIVTIFNQSKKRTGIVFCHSQNSCEQTASALERMRVSAGYYHAGLPKERRQQLQEDWQEGKIKVMCATIAFGMGVDKPDVRFVVHLTMPRSIEGFYQESGRAGRDGFESKCVLFYNRQDYNKLNRLIASDRNSSAHTKESSSQALKRVMQYCENKTDCRRKQILQYFEESFSARSCKAKCDNCKLRQNVNLTEKDMTHEARKVVQLVDKLASQNITSLLAIDILRGLKHKRIVDKGFDNQQLHGALSNHDRTTIERLVYQLIDNEVLEEYIQHNKGKHSMPSTYIKLGKHHALVKRDRSISMEFMEGANKGHSTSNHPTFVPPISRPSSSALKRKSTSNSKSTTAKKKFKTTTSKGKSSKSSSKVRPMAT